MSIVPYTHKYIIIDTIADFELENPFYNVI